MTMSGYTATVTRVDDEHGIRAVVIQADDIIHVSPELLSYASDPDRERAAEMRETPAEPS